MILIPVRSVLPTWSFSLPKLKKKMRAGFLGQNICNLGYGVATLQAPRLAMDGPVPTAEELIDQGMVIPRAQLGHHL
jgi:hypothetical protein